MRGAPRKHDHAEIIRRYVAGDHAADIAADHGIGKNYVYRVVALARQRGELDHRTVDNQKIVRHQMRVKSGATWAVLGEHLTDEEWGWVAEQMGGCETLSHLFLRLIRDTVVREKAT